MAGTDSEERAVGVRAESGGQRDEVGDDLVPAPVATPELDTDLDLDGLSDEAGSRRLRPWMLLPLVAVVLLLGWGVSVLLPGHPPAVPPSPPVGSAMPVGVSIRTPAGVRTDVDGLYLSMHIDGLPPTSANLLVTAPTRVVDRTGAITRLPDDPARWLRDQLLVRVTRVNHLLVDGRPSVQIDYRLAPPTAASRRSRTVPLFCGVGPPENKVYPWAPLSCSRISQDVRVRATFVPVDGRVLLVEAYWSRTAAGAEHIPPKLEQTYGKLVADLVFVAR